MHSEIANFSLSVAEELGGLFEFDGFCAELADEVLHRVPGAALLYMEFRPTYRGWRWHVVPIIEGVVHDAWHPVTMLPPGEYMETFEGADFVCEWELE